MIFAASYGGSDEQHSVGWLFGMIFILTLGELYLSPVGLSLVTKVTPGRVASMMMGIWFLSSFFGNYLSGFLGTFWGQMRHEVYFTILSGLGVTGGIAIWILGRPLERVVAEHK